MISSIKRSSLFAAASAATIAAMTAPAFAQDSDQPQTRRGVDEIVVTAQRTEQSLQNVPVSVAAYDEELLDEAGVKNLKDLIEIAPGLMVYSTQNETVTTIRIRGIGTVGDNPGLESSTGVVIDDVIRSRNGVGFGDLGEIERIEILRGPQGTLFGKNTSAGLVQVVTKAPEYEYGVGGELTFGSYNEAGGSGYVNLPLAEDKAAARLYVASRTRDGFIDNAGVGSESEAYDRDYTTIRGQLLFEPNADWRIRLIGDYSERDEFCCSGVPIITGPAAAFIPVLGLFGDQSNWPAPGAADFEEYNAFYDDSYAQEIEDSGVQANIEWDMGWATLTSITAFRTYESANAQDVDFTDASIAYRNIGDNRVEFETFTQEFRLNGATENFEWQTGIFIQDEELVRLDALRVGSSYEQYINLLGSSLAGQAPSPTFLNDIIAASFSPFFPSAPGTLFPAGGGMNGDVYNQSAESVAVFGQATWSVTDAFDLTFGLRYTDEDKELTASFDTTTNPGCEFFQQPIAALGGATAASLTPLGGLEAIYCLPWTTQRFDAQGYDQERSEDEWIGTIKASYRFSPELLTYASYGRGYKAGGFNLDRSIEGDLFRIANGGAPGTIDTSFPGEFVDSWEIGFKSQLAGNQLLLNGAAYWQEYEDYQLNTFLGTSFVVRSVPEVTSNGVELDLLYLPADIDGLTIQGGMAYNDSQYGEFAPGALSPIGQPEDIDNISGQTISLAPEWFWTGSVNYEKPIAQNLKVTGFVSGRWVSDYNTGSDLDAEKEQESFALFNARLSLSPMDDRWSIELWGNNIFDERYVQVAFDTPLQSGSFSGFPGAPATYGVTLRARY